MRVVLHFAGLRVGGGRTDAANLLQALPRNFPQHQFLVVVPVGVGYETLSLPPNCTVRYVPTRRLNSLWRVYFDNVRLVSMARRFQADVVFSMGNTGPVRIRGIRHVLMIRQAFIVYPLAELRSKGLTPSWRMRLMRWYFRRNLAGADALLTQTDSIAKLISERYDYEGPVYVVPKTVTEAIRTHAGDSLVGVQDQRSRILDETGFRLLYVSRYYPHKRIELACTAVSEARRQDLDIKLFLTIEAADHPRAADLVERIQSGDLPGVVTLGRVDLADLQAAYGAADAVLITSALESFSGTFLEAMAFRRPIIAPDEEFAREICGEAALYFRPGVAEDAAAAVMRLASDEDLRNELVDAGERRFRHYDVGWNTLANRYMQVITNSTEGPACE